MTPPSSTPARPPRLASPRIFRDFFSGMNSSPRQATLPPAPYTDDIDDVNRALHIANRALQNAQEAFRSGRPGSDLDVAGSTPTLASGTNTAHEPANFPTLRLPPLELASTAALLRLHSIHSQTSTQREEEAVHRQRENHYNWQRTQARSRQRERSQAGGQGRASVSNMTPIDPAIESVDLTEVDDNNALSAALAKQRQDAILAQNQGTESGRTALTSYKCPVCMDTPTDATSTVCGHVFCHRCIVDTLNWSMDQRREDQPTNRKVKGVCPVCRKPLDLKDTGPGRHLVPLELKLMVGVKRKRTEETPQPKGKGKQKLVKAETLSDDNDNDDHEDRAGRRNKAAIRAGKARQRESTEDEDALWQEFMADD